MKTKGAIEEQLTSLEYRHQRYYKEGQPFPKEKFKMMLREPCLFVYMDEKYDFQQLYGIVSDHFLRKSSIQKIDLFTDNSIKPISVDQALLLRKAGKKIWELLR